MKSSCTDYTLVTPDPEVANNGGLPVFTKADNGRYLYWSDSDSKWKLNSALNGGSPWMYTEALGSSYKACPDIVEWEKWTSWTGSYVIGAAFVCKPSYDQMCPCSSLTVAVGDASEIATWGSTKDGLLGTWSLVNDPGHSENAGRPVFANERNNYQLYFNDNGKKW